LPLIDFNHIRNVKREKLNPTHSLLENVCGVHSGRHRHAANIEKIPEV